VLYKEVQFLHKNTFHLFDGNLTAVFKPVYFLDFFIQSFLTDHVTINIISYLLYFFGVSFVSLDRLGQNNNS
jgi:hypothetical protein